MRASPGKGQHVQHLIQSDTSLVSKVNCIRREVPSPVKMSLLLAMANGRGFYYQTFSANFTLADPKRNLVQRDLRCSCSTQGPADGIIVKSWQHVKQFQVLRNLNIISWCMVLVGLLLPPSLILNWCQRQPSLNTTGWGIS